MTEGALYRMSAFSETAAGGNPAGVWVGDELPDAATMQAIAAEVGFSETAFVAPATGLRRTVRYYSPEHEVSFCGHATIATGAVLGGSADGIEYSLATAVGDVPVVVRAAHDRMAVSLTSVDTRQRDVSNDALAEFLAVLRWGRAELDDAIPPVIAYAGAWHLVLATATLERLNDLDYDFEELKTLMRREELTTLQLVWQESADVFHARNPFPVGGVVEDPATGAAAAAFGGYLRDAGIIDVPASFRIRQGEAMGRPSKLHVSVPRTGGITVSGMAVEM
jgi:PhzF family phenazine biosynthesis protein